MRDHSGGPVQRDRVLDAEETYPIYPAASTAVKSRAQLVIAALLH